MVKRKRQEQSRLAFEPVGEGSPGGSGSGGQFSPARVRYTTAAVASKSSPFKHRGQGAAASSPSSRSKKKPKQQTLDSSLGPAKSSSPQRPAPLQPSDADVAPLSIGNDVRARTARGRPEPPSSFMPPMRTAKRPMILDDSSSELAEELDDVPSSDSDTFVRRSKHKRPTRSQTEDKGEGPLIGSQELPKTSKASKYDEDSDVPLKTPRSSYRDRKRSAKVIVLDDEDEKDASEDDGARAPAARRRLARKPQVALDPHAFSDSDEMPSRKRTRLVQKGNAGHTVTTPRTSQTTSSPSRRSARKAPRSAKQKQMEILRRRRMGLAEKLTESSGSDEERRALYDTDSDHVALTHFEDDEDDEAGAEAQREPKVGPGVESSKKGSGKKSKQAAGDDDGSDIDDFIVEDEDESTLGVPGHLLRGVIPLEFTAQAHKPLKAHFRDAIDWLVHRRIDPGFKKDDEVYRLAWRKLDDEVTGLAQSKFMSTVWKPEFQFALRARPYIQQEEVGTGLGSLDNCQACGRSSHPATWVIRLTGAPYNKNSLDELESDSESESGSGNDHDHDHAEYDQDGHLLPPETKEWYVGVTCNSNAETAHNLVHWKYALRDWVEARLTDEGWMKPEKVVEREKMKRKKRCKLADGIVDAWVANNVIKALFGDFKAMLETARNKPTTARGRHRR